MSSSVEIANLYSSSQGRGPQKTKHAIYPSQFILWTLRPQSPLFICHAVHYFPVEVCAYIFHTFSDNWILGKDGLNSNARPSE